MKLLSSVDSGLTLKSWDNKYSRNKGGIFPFVSSTVEIIMNIKAISKISPRREYCLRNYKQYWWTYEWYMCDLYRITKKDKRCPLCRCRANYSRIRKIGKRNKKTGVIYK